MRRSFFFSAFAPVLILVFVCQANAVPTEIVTVGTFSTNPGSGHPGSGTDLATGNRFVVRATFDLAVTPIQAESFSGFNFFSVDLAGGAAPPNGGGLVSNGNTLDILIPLQGMDGASPFIYASDEFSHGDYPGDPFPSAVPQIHFTDPAGTNFLGFKLESLNFGPGGNFVQLATEVANQGGIPTPSTVVNIRTSGFQTVIRSVNHLEVASPVVAEAGPALSFNAASLSVTTDGGTFRNVDGTWQDNDLGAARSDKEDFLTHTWTSLGSIEGGGAGALVGADADALRPNIIVDAAPAGTRAVEDVNKTVGIAASGLQSTTDVATWQIAVNEDLTLLDGGTDTVLVSYQNAAPTASVGPGLQYNAGVTSQIAQGGVTDADLAVNAIIPGFESHSFAWSEGGSPLPGSPSASPNLLVDIADSGLTTTLDVVTFELEVTDNAGASDTDALQASYTNSLATIATAGATPMASDSILFELDVNDADLAINALGLVDFELIEVEYHLDGDPALFLGLPDLLANGSQLVDFATLQGQFGGLGDHALEVVVTDRFMRANGQSVNTTINFTVIPEPGTGALTAFGLVALATRRRPSAEKSQMRL